MATRIRRPSRRPHLYLDEWFAHRGLNDEKVGDRLGKDRTTIWKWRTQQSRLDPDKIVELAKALDCEAEDLWRPPNVISVDAMLKDASEDQRREAADLVAVILKRRH